MSWPAALIALILVFGASVLFVAISRSYLLERGVLDLPNGRSNHTRPIPRGGGIGMVAVFLLAIPCLWFKHLIAADLAWALFGGSVLVALIGILDDHRPLPAWLRFCVHCGASAWALWRLGGVSALPLGAAGAQIPSWAVSVLVLLGMVWLINLYNFMDGIDGIAGVEAVCVSGLGGLLLARSGCGGEASVAWVLAFASAGFLVWNWPPAKIFMGDAGSGFLGYVLAVFVVSSSKVQARLFWPWIILLGVFVADATFTLLRRLLSGARWYEAHCSHAYQHAAKQHGSHLKVTLTIAAINVLWLFPLAWSAVLYPARAPWIALLALASVGCVALHYEAGKNRALPPDPAEDRSEIPLHHLRGAFCLVSSKTIHCAFAKVRLPSMINAEQDVCINDESDLDAETRGSKVAQSLHESTTSRLSQPSSADKVKPAFRERLRAHFQIARLDHSVKQIFILPGIVLAFSFSGVNLDLAVAWRILLGLVAATLIACSNYVINEMLDAPFDRLHPTKKDRPAACGLVHYGAGYAQWIAMMVAGLLLGSTISTGFVLSAALLWIMGCIYNIRPVRSKDLPYVDVLSESVNNPIRFCLGWYIVCDTILPPLSLLLSYWMLGAFFMGLKRFSEYRQLGDHSVASSYRKSFRYYNEELLLNSVVFYAAAAMLFFGAFVMRYRMELILAFPIIAWMMAVYFGLSFQHESAVQNPEKLYKVRSLMIPLFFCIILLILLLCVRLPWLNSLFPKSAS